MSKSTNPIYLSVERAMEFIGDANGVLTLLKTLQQTLSSDLPLIVDLLNKDDVLGANRVLHQLKGFTPVFCVDSLVERVVAVEQLPAGARGELGVEDESVEVEEKGADAHGDAE